MKTMRKIILSFCFLGVLLPSILSAKDFFIERYINIDGELDAIDIDLEFTQKNLLKNNWLFRLTDANGLFTARINSELIFNEDYIAATNSWLEFKLNLDEFYEGFLIDTKVNLLTNEGRDNQIVAFARGPEIFEIIPFINYNFNRQGLNGTYYCFGARKYLLIEESITIKMEGTFEESYVAMEKNECANLHYNMNFFLFGENIKTKVFLEKNWGEADDQPEKVGVLISLIL
jgi:hypothetical protein